MNKFSYLWQEYFKSAQGADTEQLNVFISIFKIFWICISMQKSRLIHLCYWDIPDLKIWLAESILANNSGTKIFPNIVCFRTWWITWTCIINPGKSSEQFFKNLKILFCGHFGTTRNFSEKSVLTNIFQFWAGIIVQKKNWWVDSAENWLQTAGQIHGHYQAWFYRTLPATARGSKINSE